MKTYPAFFQFANMAQQPWLAHVYTSRHGGVSKAPYHSFNLGYHVGDEPEAVTKNRLRLAEYLNIVPEHVCYANQVHGDTIYMVRENHNHLILPDADALVTDRPGRAIVILTADCVPVLIADTKQHVVAVVHAGWKGTVQSILFKTLNLMQSVYQSHPEDMIAGIGPCISASVYKVGNDVIEKAEQAFPQAERFYTRISDSKFHFDLLKANLYWLHTFGLKKTQIELSGHCSFSQADYWYSARREGRTGRMGAAIVLR